MKKNHKIRVWYSDGTIGIYDSIQEARNEIEELVIDSNFAATVDAVQIMDEEGNEVQDEPMLGCQWSIKIVKLSPDDTE